MQQIKQELQQTIAKLKGEWGINNFSLQDLAAILEKVVAAVDKAAQLPVVPTQPEFVGGVIVAVMKFTGDINPNSIFEPAPLGSVPALFGNREGNEASLMMYNPDNDRLYAYTHEGLDPYEKYKNYVILCDRGLVLFEHDKNGNLGLIREILTNIYNHQ